MNLYFIFIFKNNNKIKNYITSLYYSFYLKKIIIFFKINLNYYKLLLINK